MTSARPSPLKARLIHALRIGLLIAMAAPLRIAGGRVEQATGATGAPPLARVQSLLSAAVAVSPADSGGGWWTVLDGSEQPIALAAQTSPAGDSAVGYRGPSNVLLVADLEHQITAARLIDSRDTVDHVRAITDSKTFFDQFTGLRIGEPIGPVDAVSGATLTSYAIAEAVSLRLAGERPSLRFPRSLSAAEATTGLGSRDGVRLPLSEAPAEDSASRGEWVGGGVEMLIQDAAGNRIGRILRTGPLVDTIIGYQGPSEVLLTLDDQGRVIDASLRQTYDNKPYVDYVRDEDYFWNHFRGLTLAELAALDRQEAGIEGVSGATMTSQAVAETIQAAAERYRQAQLRAAARPSDSSVLGPRWSWLEQGLKELRWTWKDLFTVAFVIGAIGISSPRLRGIRKLRIAWQIALVVGFGLVTGNLLSIALLFGWAEQGIAWRLAPALALVAGMALLMPPLTKHNVYCHHLCPHGAAQQLLRARTRWNWTPGPRAAKWLSAIPGLLLVAAYLLMLTRGGAPLAHWEPFNAYLWPLAAWGSVVIAIVSLAVAAVVPMAYCRFGCPTGRLLDYIRRTARSDRLGHRDAVVASLAAFGWFWAVAAG